MIALDTPVAACALARDATLWTLNTADFADLPNLVAAKPI